MKETPRTTQKEQLAGCITCKTPQFTAMVNDEGEGVYKEKFNDLIGEFTEPVSCYNCHENDPQSLKVTGSYFVKALGNDAGEGSKAPMTPRCAASATTSTTSMARPRPRRTPTRASIR